MIVHPVAIAGVVLLYLFLYYIIGSLAARVLRTPSFSLPQTLILGFFAYFFLFTLFALPMKLTLQPLSRLSILWAVVLAAAALAFLITERRCWRAKLSGLRSAFAGRQKYAVFAFLALTAALLFIVNRNDETYALWDQSYYLGDTVTSLYTNTISQYDPYTGRILEHLHTEYLLETYQNHGSVMCQLLPIHPMIENLTVMASVVVILYQLIVWETGMLLFGGNRFRSVVMAGFLALLNYYSFNLYTAAEFLLIRPSEGKTILAVLIIPTLLYLFMKTVSDYESPRWWACSFLVILGSFGLNMSSLFIIPFEITAFYIPLALKEKKLLIFRRFLMLLLPCLVVAVCYLLTKYKIYIYT